MLIQLWIVMFSLIIAHMISKHAHHLSVVLHGFLASDLIIDGPIIVWLVDQLIILIMIHLVQMLISKCTVMLPY